MDTSKWHTNTVLFDFDSLIMKEAGGDLKDYERERLDAHRAKYFKHNK